MSLASNTVPLFVIISCISPVSRAALPRCLTTVLVMDAGLWCSERMWGLGAYSDAHRDCAVGLEPIECSTLPLQSWVLSGLRVAQLPMACGLWQRFSSQTMCASLIDLCKYQARRCGSRAFSLSTAKLEGFSTPHSHGWWEPLGNSPPTIFFCMQGQICYAGVSSV